MTGLWQAAVELQDASVPFVVVTIVSERGHVPQDAGAKAIITEKGVHFGTVGGGKVEARAIVQAQTMLRERTPGPFLFVWNLQRDIGMTCGGEATYLFEGHGLQTWDIAVFGAGHVAQALTRVLLNLDCRVTCLDPRADWIARLPSSPKLTIMHVPEPAKEVARFSENTSFVVVTQGHGTDLPILEEIARIRADAPYVGAIGSPSKADRLRRDLKAKGVSADWIEKLRSPIGLSFGSNHPGEIAVSIVGQLLTVRGKGGPKAEPPKTKT